MRKIELSQFVRSEERNGGSLSRHIRASYYCLLIVHLVLLFFYGSIVEMNGGPN